MTLAWRTGRGTVLGERLMITDEKIEAAKQKAREAFVRMPLSGTKHPSEVADAVAEAIGAAIREMVGDLEKREAAEV